MAISTTWITNYLLKKVGYGVATTSLAKSPASESTPSPFLSPASTIWQLSSSIAPASAPTLLSNSSVVTVYNATGTVQCVNDITSNVANQTWTTGSTDWIPTQFGAGYQVQVYAGPAGTANPQTLRSLSPDGSGNNDGWYFDYQAGVLIFADTNVPTAVAGNVVYVSGARYTGPFGISNFPEGLTIGNIVINGNTITGNTALTINGNLSAGNATFTTITTPLLSATAGNVVTLFANNFSTANAQITGGNATSITNLTATNSALTTLVATNFSSANAQIASGNVTATAANFTTTYTANFGTGNAVITGGSADNFPVGANTAATGAFTQLTAANLSITANTQSDSVTTGAVTIAGGIGIGRNLTVGGNAVIAGSLTINGAFEYVNATNSTYVDTILELNTGANGAPLTAPNGYDVGIGSHYYSGGDQTAFFGYQNSTGNFVYFANVTSEAGNVITGALGTINAGQLIVANTTASINYATGAVTVDGGVGIGGNLNVNSNISANNITATGGIVTANIGNFVNINTVIGNIQANLGAFETYANANIGAYQTWANANLATLTSNIANLQTDTTSYYAWANANLAYTTDTISNITANLGAFETNVAAYQVWANANVADISSTISTTQANLGAYQVWANANVSGLYSNITAIQSNLGAYQTWANANVAELSSNISNLQTSGSEYQYWANANAAIQSSNIGDLQSNIGSYYYWANANVAELSSNISNLQIGSTAYYYWANANVAELSSNISNLQIGSTAYYYWANANIAGTVTNVANLQTTTSAYQYWANANVASLAGNIASLGTGSAEYYYWANANATSQATAITSLATGANANTAAYLTAYTGNVSTGNIVNATGIYSSNYYYANGMAFVSTTLANTADITANLTNGENVGLSLTATGVSAGNYGNSTVIPTIVVDNQGRVTSITSNAFSTSSITINLAGTTGNGSVSGSSTLNFAGNYGVTANVAGSTVYIGTPQDLQTTATPQFVGANVVTLNASLVNAQTVGNANTVLAGASIRITNDAYFGGNLTTIGNLSILGNAIITQSINLSVNDAVIDLHMPSNLAPLTMDDGLNIGLALHYYDGAASQAFLGRVNQGPFRGNLAYYSKSTDSANGYVVGTTLGTIVAGDLISANTTPSVNAETGALTVLGGVGIAGNLNIGGNVGNLVLNPGSGISTNGSFGSDYQVLMSQGVGVVPKWATTYYYPTDMYDFTQYSLGYMTLAPNQDPVTLGFLPNVTIPYGAVWVYTSNPIDANATIYSPNSTSTLMMWVTIDGSGPYDEINNPTGKDYWFNITPPPGNQV